MAKTLTDIRNQAQAQLDAPSLVAVIPVLTYPFAGEWTRFLARLTGAGRSQPRLFLFSSTQVDVHVRRWHKALVGRRIMTLDPATAKIQFVESTREGSSRISFGGSQWTVLDEHMRALYDVARRSGFSIDADDDPRATSPIEHR